MTNQMKDGGPAFPHREYESRPYYHGMSLRDYFAARALQGILANEASPLHEIVAAAYEIADAMLEEREK